jgi:hypothetical protein
MRTIIDPRQGRYFPPAQYPLRPERFPFPFPVRQWPPRPAKDEGDRGFVEDLLGLAIARLRRRNDCRADRAISHIRSAQAELGKTK